MYWILFKFVVMAAVCVLSLRLGVKLAMLRTRSGTLLVIGVVSSLLFMAPYVGWALSAYFMVRLARRLNDAELWPDAIIVAAAGQISLWLAHCLLF